MPLSLIFSRLNNPSSLSLLSLYDRCSKTLISIMVLYRSCSSICLYSTWKPSSGPSPTGLTWAQQRGKITSLSLMMRLCLTQPRLLLAAFATTAHWWLMVILPTTTPNAFSAKLLSSQAASSLCWCTGLFLQRYRTSQLPLLNFMRLL